MPLKASFPAGTDMLICQLSHSSFSPRNLSNYSIIHSTYLCLVHRIYCQMPSWNPSVLNLLHVLNLSAVWPYQKKNESKKG
jgi:hypothetical protein